eukprot:2038659-Alexandrium_andersonii.AAC.1
MVNHSESPLEQKDLPMPIHQGIQMWDFATRTGSQASAEYLGPRPAPVAGRLNTWGHAQAHTEQRM